MTVDVKPFDWKLLRVLARAGGPVTGRALRHTPSRHSKSGEFLGELVGRGLIAVAAPDPDPFAAAYALTPLGRHAAEYGEYEGRMPWDAPAAPAPDGQPRATPGPAAPKRSRGRPRSKG